MNSCFFCVLAKTMTLIYLVRSVNHDTAVYFVINLKYFYFSGNKEGSH